MCLRAHWFMPLVALAVLGAKCGGAGRTETLSSAGKVVSAPPRPAVDACSVLTPAEIEEVTGAKSVAPRIEAYGNVGTCNFHAADQLIPVVSILLAPGMPNMSNSTEMAAWRSKQTSAWGDVKLIIEPVEGLGVPAIRNQLEGVEMVTVEADVRGILLDVTTFNLEHSKKLAAKAMVRVP